MCINFTFLPDFSVCMYIYVWQLSMVKQTLQTFIDLRFFADTIVGYKKIFEQF